MEGMAARRVYPALMSEVRRYGRFDVSGCFNCGSCTLSCDLVTDSVSFPRRTMQHVLLGLRETLLGSVEPWVCHDCGDCSTACPRQTEPREAMMTVRRYLGAQYDWTGISSRIYRSKFGEAGALSIVAACVLLLVFFYHFSWVKIPLGDFASTSMGLEHMFPKITYFTLTVFLFPLLILCSNAVRMYWFTMHRGTVMSIPLATYVTEAREFVLHSVTHMQFRKCKDESIRARWIKHWFLALGYVMISVILVFFLRWFQTDSVYPIYHPQRLLGYFATVFLIFGSMDVLIGRIRKRKEIYKFSEPTDLIFPALLLLTAASGIAVHIFRISGLALVAHYTYALHLVISVPMLVITVPFGKWSHVLYRPLALYFQAVKDRAMGQHGIGEMKAA